MVRLPVEYQEVEYLESTGTQYIKTNYTPTATEDMKIEMDYMFTKTQSGDSFLFGAKASGTSPITFQCECFANERWYCGSGLYQFRNVLGDVGASLNKRYSFIIDGNVLKIDDNSASSTGTQSNLYSVPLYVFAGNWDEATKFINKGARIYNLSFTANGVKEADFIPCYRKSDSEPGMYDTVTKQFFTNQGTGTFIVGNDVSWDTASLIERRRQILLNTPHIETISGSIASFETDVPALVKDCKVYFTPVQEGTGDPSPDNVRPISGWTGIEFYNSSPNIFPLHPPATAFRGQFSTGDTTISSASIMKCWTIYVGKNKKLTYQRKATGTSCNLAFCDTPLTSRTGAVIYNALNMTNRSNQYINSGEHPYLVMCATDASYAPGSGYDIKELMLSFGTTVKPYAPRVDNNLIIPDWESEVGEVYGGYVDLVKGEVVEEYQKFVLDGINRWLTAGIKTSDSRGGIYVNYVEAYNYFTDGGLSGMIKPNSLVSQWDWKSNRFSVSNSDPGDYAMLQLAGGHNPYIRLFVHKSQLGDISDRSHITDSMKAWLSDNPIEISYKPITPITHQLTPQVIKTLKGINNIWSDANGNIELRFWKH